MSSGVETADLIDTWIYGTLSTDPELVTLVGGEVHGPLVLDPPDEGAPYVTFSLSSARDVVGSGMSRIVVDAIYLVKTVAQTSSKDLLVPVARRIDQLLNARQVDVPGGSLTSRRETTVDYAEVIDASPFLHLGGTYRIRANSST